MDVQMLEAAKQQAEICKVFSNANRVLILWTLGNKEMAVGDIADAIASSLQNTSQHLRLMKDKGIVVSRRRGHEIYYHVAEHGLVKNCWILQCTM
jgi:ArsR family transcriptional regulator